jgi:hypothetical protein
MFEEKMEKNRAAAFCHLLSRDIAFSRAGYDHNMLWVAGAIPRLFWVNPLGRLIETSAFLADGYVK